MSNIRWALRPSIVVAIAVLAVTSSAGLHQTALTGVKHAPVHVKRNPDGTPAHGLRNEWVSSNWSGYELANFQTGQKYTQAKMTWVVPAVQYGPSTDSTSSTEYSRELGGDWRLLRKQVVHQR